MKGLIFTYVLCYGGALASLFDPFVGLLVYVCFSIIKPEYLWSWSVPQGNYSRIVAIALLIGWAIRGFGNWESGKSRWIAGAFIMFWLWSIPSAWGAPNQERAWYFVEAVFKILLPFLAGLSLVDSVRKLKQLIWVIVLSQSYIAFEFNQYYFQGYNYVKEVGFAGLEEGSIAIGMVTALGMCIFLILESEKWWQKAVALVGAGCLVHVVLFSFSRGGMLGLISVGIVTLVLAPKRPFHCVVLGLGGLAALALAGQQVVARFMTTFNEGAARDSSAQSRLDLWANCWDAMITHPILGLGPWQFPLVAHSTYGWDHAKEGHSLWLQIGAELGVPGLVFIALFYGLCVFWLLPITRDSF